jgi:hypothetical protein
MPVRNTIPIRIRAGKQTPQNNHLDLIRSQLQSVPPESDDRAAFEFAQFKECEDLGDIPAAFAALQRGNAIMYRHFDQDIGRESALFDRLIARCTPSLSGRITASILDYCGLPHEPGCTDVRRNTTAIGTLSSTQVREPIHKRALGEWRRYATQLEPLRELLGDRWSK